jgi:hypothetical protein
MDAKGEVIPGKAPDVSFEECRHHNCADEECEDYQQMIQRKP